MRQIDLPEPLGDDIDIHIAAAAEPHAIEPNAGIPIAAAAHEAQIDLPDALLIIDGPAAKKPRYGHRSVESIAHARGVQVQRRLAMKLEQAEIKHAESESCMQLCASLMPGVGKLLGEKHHEVGRVKNPNPVDVGAIVLDAFNPKLLSHSIGIKA